MERRTNEKEQQELIHQFFDDQFNKGDLESAMLKWTRAYYQEVMIGDAIPWPTNRE